MTVALYTYEEAIQLAAEYHRNPIKDKAYQHMSRLGASVRRYLAWYGSGGLAEATLVTCESDCARLVRDSGPDATIQTLTVEDLMLSLETVPVKSQRRMRAHWSGLFDWALEYAMNAGDVRTAPNPVRRLPKMRRRPAVVHDIFTGVELAAIVDAARTSPVLKVVNEMRALLLTETGMRAGGALNLRVRDVNLYERRVLLREKGDKERLVPIRGEVVQAFDRYQLETYPLLDREPLPDDFLWFPVTANYAGLTGLDPTRPVCYSTFRNWWIALLDRADVRYRRPHMTRHTYATDVLDATDGNLYAAQELLGHVSADTTRLYLHSSDRHKIRGVEALQAFRNQREG